VVETYNHIIEINHSMSLNRKIENKVFDQILYRDQIFWTGSRNYPNSKSTSRCSGERRHHEFSTANHRSNPKNRKS
jgi:hypothetical protein